MTFRFGLGVEADVPRATAYYVRACELGDLTSCLSFAKWLQSGKDVTPDPRLAANILERLCDASERAGAAELGGDALAAAVACRELARALELGLGVARDPERARRVDARACDQGFAPSCAAIRQLDPR